MNIRTMSKMEGETKMNETKHLNQIFFERDAAEVAKDLLGSIILYRCKDEVRRYRIIETEAYYHNEKDNDGKAFCYGAGKTKDMACSDVSAPLFSTPGTWCVYGGQLLISVKDNVYSDNVLIKRIKDERGNTFGPDGIAKELHLYKTKPDYSDCHGKYSLCGCDVTLAEAVMSPQYICDKRIGIKEDSKLNFKFVESN